MYCTFRLGPLRVSCALRCTKPFFDEPKVSELMVVAAAGPVDRGGAG